LSSSKCFRLNQYISALFLLCAGLSILVFITADARIEIPLSVYSEVTTGKIVIVQEKISISTSANSEGTFSKKSS